MMKIYYYELEEQTYNPAIEVDGTIRARNDDEAIALVKAIGERHNLEVNYVGVRVPDFFGILHKIQTVYDRTRNESLAL